MTPIKYEPYAFHFYLYSLNSLWFYCLSMFGRSLILFFVVLGIHFIFLILHLYSKGEVIGEIFDLKIKLNKYRRPIPWEEITKWRYVPPLYPGKLVTPSSFFDSSRIELETAENTYQIEGVNEFIIQKYLKKYLPGKQRGIGISSYIILNILGLIPIIIFSVFLGK